MYGLFLLKPETLENEEVYEEILNLIQQNFKIEEQKLIQVDEEIFLAHQPKVKSDFEKQKSGVLSILEHFKKGKSLAILVYGEHTLKKAFEIKQYVREKYINKDLMKKNPNGEIIYFPPNFIHTSTDLEELKNDVKVFFPNWQHRVNLSISQLKNKELENAPKLSKYFK